MPWKQIAEFMVHINNNVYFVFGSIKLEIIYIEMSRDGKKIFFF